MEIRKTVDGTKLTLALEGGLDTLSSPQLEGELDLKGVTELVIDLSKVTYISSAGLRVFLVAYKTLAQEGGKMTLTSPQEAVRKFLAITGFSKILTIL